MPFIVLGTLVGASSAWADPAAETAFAASVRPFVVKNCFMCHNPQLKNAFANPTSSGDPANYK